MPVSDSAVRIVLPVAVVGCLVSIPPVFAVYGQGPALAVFFVGVIAFLLTLHFDPAPGGDG